MITPKVDFVIGEDLYAVSVNELETRITLLNEEISRLEAEITKKLRERDAADKLFGD